MARRMRRPELRDRTNSHRAVSRRAMAEVKRRRSHHASGLGRRGLRQKEFAVLAGEPGGPGLEKFSRGFVNPECRAGIHLGILEVPAGELRMLVAENLPEPAR